MMFIQTQASAIHASFLWDCSFLFKYFIRPKFQANIQCLSPNSYSYSFSKTFRPSFLIKDQSFSHSCKNLTQASVIPFLSFPMFRYSVDKASDPNFRTAKIILQRLSITNSWTLLFICGYDKRPRLQTILHNPT